MYEIIYGGREYVCMDFFLISVQEPLTIIHAVPMCLPILFTLTILLHIIKYYKCPKKQNSHVKFDWDFNPS